MADVVGFVLVVSAAAAADAAPLDEHVVAVVLLVAAVVAVVATGLLPLRETKEACIDAFGSSFWEQRTLPYLQVEHHVHSPISTIRVDYQRIRVQPRKNWFHSPDKKK